jgi:hypothetical protein
MVDLVGIEPTTSSIPCSFKGGRRLVFKQLATGISGRNGVSGAISGQFPAQIFNLQNRRAAWAGVLVARFSSRMELQQGVCNKTSFCALQRNRFDPLVSKQRISAKVSIFQSM